MGMVSFFKVCFDRTVRLTNQIVLRYSPYSKAIAQILSSGDLGEIVNVQHIEPVRKNHSQRPRLELNSL